MSGHILALSHLESSLLVITLHVNHQPHAYGLYRPRSLCHIASLYALQL